MSEIIIPKNNAKVKCPKFKEKENNEDLDEIIRAFCKVESEGRKLRNLIKEHLLEITTVKKMNEHILLIAELENYYKKPINKILEEYCQSKEK